MYLKLRNNVKLLDFVKAISRVKNRPHFPEAYLSAESKTPDDQCTCN